MVLSNYKCLHIQIQNSRIIFQQLQVHSSNVSSNRIKIQVILLILQLETDYFSKFFISENAPFEAVVLQSSQGLPELLFYTKKSYRILQLQFQLQFYKGTHPPYNIQATSTRAHPENSPSRNTILHAEDKELFQYYYYTTEGKETFSPDSRKEILCIEGKEIF